jgi:hypothetical protein
MNRFTLPIILIAVMVVWYLDRLAHTEIATAARLVVGAISIALMLALILFLMAWGYVLVEKALTARAKRQAAQRDASVMVIRADEREQVYVREADTRAVYRPLHLNPAQYQNGKPGEPTPVELAIYQLWHSKPAQPQAAVPLLLQAQTTPELLPILDSAQRVLVIGASGAGKTNLLQWVVSRRGGGVLVIDPHAAPGKWGAAKVVGIGSNFPEIEATLDNLIELMVRRYQEIGQGLVREGEHPRLTIIIDEWMSIAYQCHNAQDTLVRLLTESRKAAFSVIIGSHSERVKSLGLDGKGDLKDGFLFIRLWLEGSEHRATFDYGRGERPCLLPSRYAPELTGPVIEVETINEPKPTKEEQTILDLHVAGQSHAAICEAVWGYKSSKKYPEIEAVLAKFGPVHRAQA